MPYSVKKHPDCPKNKPWAVVKDDGSKLGCHASRTSARQQQRALYANEGKMMNEEDEEEVVVSEDQTDDHDEEDEEDEKSQKCYDDGYRWRPFGGATSFNELEAIDP